MTLAFAREEKTSNGFQSSFHHPTSIKHLVSELSQEDFILGLELAVKAIQHLKTSSETIGYREALDSELQKQAILWEKEKSSMLEKQITVERIKESEKSTLTQRYQAEKKELEDKILALKSSIQANEILIEKLKEGMMSNRSFFEQGIQEVARQKEEQYQAEIKRLMEQHKQMFELSEAASQRALESLKSAYADQEARFKQSLVSSEKGKEGEREFEELVLLHTKWGELQNTSKLSHATDREASIRGCKTLFEIKNYSQNIPTPEVEKFLRDMEEHSDSPLGVFVSLKSNIRGKYSNGFLQIAWTPRSQLLVFVNNFYSHSAPDILSFIDMCADIATLVFKASKDKPSESSELLLLNSKLEQIKIYIEKEIKKVCEFINTLVADRKFLLATINRHHDTYMYQMGQLKQSLSSMLEILLGTQEEPLKEQEDISVKLKEEKDNQEIKVELIEAPAMKKGKKKAMK